EKRSHISGLLKRAAVQNAIPIVNYNDPVSFEENRQIELSHFSKKGERIVECIDNDETAATIAELVKAPILLILTSVEGIYKKHGEESTLIKEIYADNAEDLLVKIDKTIAYCNGASRDGAGGAAAKLKYIRGVAAKGTTVIIGHARHGIAKLVDEKIQCTRIGLR
ncbi:MAG: uridylate kinase, partial [Clostridiales bacterium]|nr:uridylate kinase [Clostridiales bacterium]